MSARNSNGAPNSTTAYDIGVFVVKYQRMVELLFPLRVVWDGALYVLRWENYFLTLLVLTAASCVFYYPVILLCLVVVSALILLAIGKHYSQSRQQFLLKRKDPPKPSVLHQDQHHMKQYHKEQKNSHKQLMEYKKILENAELFLTKAMQSLEYLHSIVLWQSPEASLCVSVLLCVFLVLLCTVPLRSLLAALPIIILCLNRHFLERTVSLWKDWLDFIYSKARLKSSEIPAPPPPSEAPPTSPSEAGNSRERASTAPTSAAAPLQDHSAESVPLSSAASSDSEDTTRPVQRSRFTSSAVQPPAGSGSEAAEVTRGSPRPPSISRKDIQGFCSKCNASFAKLLKRKHDCNYCGQSYCGSCTVKVKKALLGATSPAAFEESVRVCLDCKSKLDSINSSSHPS